MKYNPEIHRRHSVRLKEYDYSRAGLYFITICTQNRLFLFGKIENGEMLLNDAGKNTNECWLQIPEHFPQIKLHGHIIMPNHIHGIIEITKITTVGAKHFSPSPNRANVDSPLRQSPSQTIGSVVRGFKIGVTKWFHVNTDIQTIWQRNYYEHIIRDDKSYHKISEYIQTNPLKWLDDIYHE
jgi:putative transposase